MKTPQKQREANARYRAKVRERAEQDGITHEEARALMSAEFQAEKAARLAAKPVKEITPKYTEEERLQARRAASARSYAKDKAEREELGLTVAQHLEYKAGKPLDTIRTEGYQREAQRAARRRNSQPRAPRVQRYKTTAPRPLLTPEERKANQKASAARTRAKHEAKREELGLTWVEYRQYQKGKPVEQIKAESLLKMQRKTAGIKDEDEDDDLLNPQAQQLLIEIMHEQFAPNIIANAHTREPRAQAMLKLADALITQGKQEDNGDLHRAGVALAFYRSPEEKRTHWMNEPEDGDN